MHIYFSGIGGSGLSALANIALDAGFVVSGSDLYINKNIQNLQSKTFNLNLQQTEENIQKTHKTKKIDWLVYTSAITKEHPELVFANKENIKISKRDQFLNFLLQEKKLKLIAIAGTHGKTTTTAMLVWLFKQFNLPVSYLIGSNISFGQSGEFKEQSKYFILECDEFDRNFLHFSPARSIISSLDYDHPDTYANEGEYLKAFAKFLDSVKESTYLYQTDWQKIAPFFEKKPACFLSLTKKSIYFKQKLKKILTLPGEHNRNNAYLSALCFLDLFTEINKKSLNLNWQKLSKKQIFSKICSKLCQFPGTERRFERLRPNLYSDYAHHPTEIQATLQLAREVLNNQK